jgi:hypothetical protein
MDAGAVGETIPLSTLNVCAKEEPANFLLQPFIPSLPSVISKPCSPFAGEIPGTRTNGIVLDQRIVCIGSCVQCILETGDLCLFVICDLIIGSSFGVYGYQLLHTEVPRVMKLSLAPIWLKVQRFQETFQIVCSEEEKKRLFWPDFVVFVTPPPIHDNRSAIDFCLQEVGKEPCSLRLLEKNHILHHFVDSFLRAVNRLMKSRTRGLKQLMVWQPLQFYEPLLEFLGLGKGSKKVILSDDFFPLSILLGNQYFFHKKQEGQYSKQGWGFWGEECCNHYISQVVFTLSAQDLKCKVLQLLQNPSSKIFQTQ